MREASSDEELHAWDILGPSWMGFGYVGDGCMRRGCGVVRDQLQHRLWTCVGFIYGKANGNAGVLDDKEFDKGDFDLIILSLQLSYEFLYEHLTHYWMGYVMLWQRYDTMCIL